MKFICILALIALSVASPSHYRDYADDDDDDQVDYFYNRNPQGDDGDDYRLTRRTTDEQYSTDDQDYSSSQGSDQPTLTEVVFGRPLKFPVMPRIDMRPWFQMRPIVPKIPFFPFSDDDDSSEERNTSYDHHFPNFFDGSTFGEPDLKDLPNDYENSTYEVKNINGSKIHINQTVNKKSGDGFNSFFHFKVVKVVPEFDTENDTTDIEGSGYDVIIDGPSEVQPEIKHEIKPEVTSDNVPEVTSDNVPEVTTEDQPSIEYEPKVTTEDQPSIEYEPKVTTEDQPSTEYEPKVSTEGQPPAEDEADIPNSIDNVNKIDSSDSNLDNQDLKKKKFRFKRSIMLPRISYLVNDLEREAEYQSPDEAPRVSVLPSNGNRPRARSFTLGNVAANRNRNTNFLENLKQSNFDNSYRTNYRTNYVYKNMDGGSYIYKLPHKTPSIRMGRPSSSKIPKRPYILVVKKGSAPSDTFGSVNEGTIPDILDRSALNEPEPNLQVVPLNVRKPNPKNDYRNLLEPSDIAPILSDSETLSENVGQNIGKTEALDNLRIAFDNYINAEVDGTDRRYNNEDEVETIMVIRPPDLSRDTLVNKVAADRSTSQQGLTLIDPDIEVFDLALVLKELQSHDDDVYISNN